MNNAKSSNFDFDYLVIGSGMGGLSVAGLLANAGHRVAVLEAHDTPGGYAHSFRVKAYRFCAQVHYIFNCGEGESVHNLLTKLGIADEVPFLRLDPEGFDHIVVAGDRPVRIRIPNGLEKFHGRLRRRFPGPDAEKALRRYFDIVALLGRELDRLAVPDRVSLAAVRAVFDARHVLRYRKWTLEDLYEHVKMPPRLRAILAGQCGDYLLPPRDVSLLLHVALVTLYDRGAYYPKYHYGHFVEKLADAVRSKPGCVVLLENEVDRIETDGKRTAIAVTTTKGKRYTARHFISNVDPRRTEALIAGLGRLEEKKKKKDYAYSCGTFTMYLGVRGLDLQKHGFGSFNVWHYPHEDINRIYDDQLIRHDLSNPWLFLSTPTLHSDEPGLCPPGDQIIEIATACDYTRFATLRATDRRAYNIEKKNIRERILDIIDASYVPGIRDHLVMRVTGTPATNARFVRAPDGNSYGSALTPENVGPHRRPFRSSRLDNMWLVNATAGFPSVAGTIAAGIRLYTNLSGDQV